VAPESDLRSAVYRLVDEQAYSDAAVVQRWLVARHVEGSMVDLACYESRAGHVEPALYWLERAARQEGVGVSWAIQDADLALVRQDSRWPALFSYLRAANGYWAQSGIERANRVVPRATAPSTGFPLVIGLHGYGASESFFGPELQALADETGTVFLSLSGTIPQGPGKFEWSEDLVRDEARIERGVEQLQLQLDRHVALDSRRRVLMGFSQGGEVAAALLARYPDAYVGAIVFSPGSVSGLKPEASPATVAWQTKSVLIRVGGGEHRDTVANAEAVREYFIRLGARVDYYAYPDQRSHSLPPDYAHEIKEWIRFASGGSE
jgi:phospholipase/carboxylesterase